MGHDPVPLEVVPFTEECAIEIAAWPVDSAEAVAWAGKNAIFPFPPEEFRRWHQDRDSHPLVAFENGKPIAYGELWIDEPEDEIELARIIVNPTCRGRGIGRSFVTALVEKAAKFGLKKAMVRIAPGNERARRCYRAAGFGSVPKNDQEKWNEGQPTDYRWLQYEFRTDKSP